MKELVITSKTFGVHTFLVDDSDYDKLQELGGKWCVVEKRTHHYAQKRINDKIVELHRWLMQPPEGLYVDHINGDTYDNTRSNLRVCTNAANIRNGKVRKQNTSGYTGVSWSDRYQKWCASIMVNRKGIHLGRYADINEAIKVRQLAVERYWSV